LLSVPLALILSFFRHRGGLSRVVNCNGLEVRTVAASFSIPLGAVISHAEIYVNGVDLASILGPGAVIEWAILNNPGGAPGSALLSGSTSDHVYTPTTSLSGWLTIPLTPSFTASPGTSYYLAVHITQDPTAFPDIVCWLFYALPGMTEYYDTTGGVSTWTANLADHGHMFRLFATPINSTE
jgi:hypothetical protein